MTNRRRFSPSERLALYLAADGKCQLCGKPLDQDFHADHVHPYSKGGETDVINGQALCSECNIKKGSKAVQSITYREWQEEEHGKFLASKEKWFMLVATPGAGKTTAMLRNAHVLKESHEVDMILVVTPTLPLKMQWKKAASRFGLRFIQEFNGYYNEGEFDGVIVTYQQIAMSPEVIRTLFRERKVFVILDEPHHMGEVNRWGSTTEYALEKTYRGILGSGTPFRTDKYPIPFVQYIDGKLRIDYQYSYGKAFADQIVRGVFFRRINARAEWMPYNDELITATFYEEMSEARARELLNIILSPKDEWVQIVLKQAINDIRHIRRTEQANAALLIVCKNTYHASEMAKQYERLSGVRPIIVSSSEDHEDSDAIDAFRDSDDECIIAVDMISEGVDIPRLRGLVYATNKVTQLYFEQILGRIVRVEPGRELANGLCYLPSDPRLLRLADAFKQERDFVIDTVERVCSRCGQSPCVCDKTRKVCDKCGQDPCVCPKQERMFELIEMEAQFDGGKYGEDNFTELEIVEAGQWLKTRGYRIPIEEAARIRRYELQRAVEAPTPMVATLDPEQRRNKLKSACNGLAFSIALDKTNHDKELAKVVVAQIHNEWIRGQGGKPQHQETIDGLEAKLMWLRKQRKDQ